MNEIDRLQHLAGIVNEKDAGNSDNVKMAVGHVDNERDMIRRNLFQMGSYCVELYKMLDKLPDSDFPHWWQAKIVKASTYIGDAKHYLENSLEVPPGDDMTQDGTGPGEIEVSDPDVDDNDPSGVS